MEKSIRTQIKIGLVVTVLGGLILALILYLLGYISPFFKRGSDMIFSLWGYFKSPSKVPMWLFWLLVVGCVPAILKIVKLLLPVDYQSAYREEEFFGVIWRWSYPLHLTADRVWCYCPQCDTRLIYNPYILADVISITLFCETCNKQYQTFNGDVADLLSKVIRQIDRNIRTGIWRSKVGDRKKTKRP